MSISNYKQSNNTRGFSLLEIMLSLGIFSLIIVSVVTLTIGSFSFFEYSQSLRKANLLLEEGYEAVNAIADDYWNELIYGQSALAYEQGRWRLTSEGDIEVVDGIYRTILFSPVYRDNDFNICTSTEEGAFLDVLSKKAKIVVEWQTARGATSTVQADFIVSPINNRYWTQSDWSAGDGQSVWSDASKYDNRTNIATASGSLALSAVVSTDYFGSIDHEEEFSGTVYGSNFYGQRFVSPEYDLSLKSVSIYAKKVSEGTPEDDLYFSLYDQGAGETTANGIVSAKEGASTDPAWLTLELDEAVTIASNSVYIIYVYSPGSLEENGYKFFTTNVPPEGEPDPAKFFGGNEFATSNDGGNGWSYDDSKYFSLRANYDAMLPGSYETGGELVSSAYRATSSVFSSIEWDAIDECDGCEVRFQIMTAPDAGGLPGTWYPYWCGPDGKDGDEDDYFSTSTGNLIDQSMNGDGWIRYKAILSGNGNSTPQVSEVRINYR